MEARIIKEENGQNSELSNLMKMIVIIKPNSIEIQSGEMNDFFHIKQRNLLAKQRAFDACKDKYYYKRSPTSYKIQFFDIQIVNKYKCEGRLKCGNSECEVFRRTSNLNYRVSHKTCPT